MKYFVTGGAGFIGSNIVDRILNNSQNQVVVYDNLSTGKEAFFIHNITNPNFKFIKADLSETDKLTNAMQGCKFVFHVAGHADVRSGFTNHNIDHEQNLEMAQNVLEAMCKNNIKNIAFSSTSSVYGDAKVHPTPENYPFKPTSLYGASKAAAESYICAYSSYYDIKSYIFRFVSFVGERYTHGIVYDVLKKLKLNPSELELYSDGTPKKSSVYVQDGIGAIFKVIDNSKDQFNIYNIGHDEVSTVSNIVNWILDEAGYKDVKLNWLGKGSNWKGDNEFVHLNNDKLKALGWKPSLTIEQGIRKTVRYLVDSKIL